MDAFGGPRLGLDVALASWLGGEEQLVSRELSSAVALWLLRLRCPEGVRMHSGFC